MGETGSAHGGARLLDRLEEGGEGGGEAALGEAGVVAAEGVGGALEVIDCHSGRTTQTRALPASRSIRIPKWLIPVVP